MRIRLHLQVGPITINPVHSLQVGQEISGGDFEIVASLGPITVAQDVPVRRKASISSI